MRRALGWAFSNRPGEWVREGLRLTIALSNIWVDLTLQTEAYHWIQKGLGLLEAGEEDLSLRALALFFSSDGAFKENHLVARDILEESLALFRSSGNKIGQIDALLTLADYIRQEDPPKAHQLADEAAALSTDIQYMWRLALSESWMDNLLSRQGVDKVQEVLEKSQLFLKENGMILYLLPITTNRGHLAFSQGDAKAAQKYYQQVLDLALELENKFWIAVSLGSLGMVAYLRDDFRAMAALLQDSLECFREQDDRGSTCWILRNLAIAAKREGNLRQADQHYRESLSISQALQDDYGVFASLAGLGGIAVAEGEELRAARLLGAAEALFESFTKPLDRIEQIEFERDKAALCGHLDRDALQAAREEGRQMTLEQALNLACA